MSRLCGPADQSGLLSSWQLFKSRTNSHAKKLAREITMSTLELKASDAVASANPSNLKSHDFAIMWSYAIAVLAVLLVVSYGTTATQVGSSVDFASLSIPL